MSSVLFNQIKEKITEQNKYTDSKENAQKELDQEKKQFEQQAKLEAKRSQLEKVIYGMSDAKYEEIIKLGKNIVNTINNEEQNNKANNAQKGHIKGQ